MKTKTLRNRSLLAMLSLLGFAGCDLFGEDMYGTPPPLPDLLVKGRVSDPQGTPIPDIRVESNTALQDPPATEADGSFAIRCEIADEPAELRFIDNDGPANGGDFATGRIAVAVDDTTLDERQNAYVKDNVEVVLHEKK